VVLGTRTISRVFSIMADPNLSNLRMPPMSGNFQFDNRLGFATRPKLGIKIEDLEDGNGVKITEVDEELPAGKAGLKEQDLITDVNGKAVNSVDEMKANLKDLKEGDTIKLGIKRNGKSQTIDLKLPKKLKTANL